MKIYHSRSSLDQMSRHDLQKLHKQYVWVIFSILLIGGALSLLSIWDYIAYIWQYAMLVLLAILWPWIMQSSYMARKLKEE